jgi:S-DNA-T family DNA segregation ATPase FtsK/SpoIIIE
MHLQMIAALAEQRRLHAELRPPLDEVSRQAVEDRRHAEPSSPPTDSPADASVPPATRTETGGHSDGAETILWSVLSLAPDDGTTVPDLMEATQMSRPWVYLRLRELAEHGQVIQVSRGRWRAASGDAA